MSSLLSPSLPWELKAAGCMAPGILLVVAFLLVPKSILAQIGQVPFLSPNWITVWRVVIFWIGAALFFRVDPFIGYLAIVVASILDVIDGRMATALREHLIPRSRRDAKVGEWLDPLADKVTNLPLIGVFAALGIVNLWLAAAIIATDVIGTFFREPINLDARFKAFIGKVNGTKRNRRPSRANAVGKAKALLQSLALVACGPPALGWIRPFALPNILLVLALVAGFVSLLARFETFTALSRLVSRAGSHFTHKEL